MTNAAPPSADRPESAVLRGLLELRADPTAERIAVSDDAIAEALATAQVYAFASVDYPGAAQSMVFDSNGTTAVGAFTFDPTSSTSPNTAFTFAGGAYQILAVPSSTSSAAGSSSGRTGTSVATYGWGVEAGAIPGRRSR